MTLKWVGGGGELEHSLLLTLSEARVVKTGRSELNNSVSIICPHATNTWIYDVLRFSGVTIDSYYFVHILLRKANRRMAVQFGTNGRDVVQPLLLPIGTIRSYAYETYSRTSQKNWVRYYKVL